MKQSTTRLFALSIAGAAIIGLSGPAAMAAPADNPTTKAVATIHTYFPDMTTDEITQALTEEAKSKGTTLSSLAPQTAAEVQQAAAEVQKDREADGNSVAPRSSSGVATNKILPNGKAMGDIFWTASGLGWNHVGLYYHTDVVAEAPGVGKETHREYTRNTHVANNYGRYSIRASGADRLKAANWAWAHFHRPYSGNFFANRIVETKAYNCSQYVWASYKISGYDLDSNLGHGVYPDDIRDSKLLTHY